MEIRRYDKLCLMPNDRPRQQAEAHGHDSPALKETLDGKRRWHVLVLILPIVDADLEVRREAITSCQIVLLAFHCAAPHRKMRRKTTHPKR